MSRAVKIKKKNGKWIASTNTTTGVRTGPVSVDGIDPRVVKINRMLGCMLDDRKAGYQLAIFYSPQLDPLIFEYLRACAARCEITMIANPGVFCIEGRVSKRPPRFDGGLGR